MSLSVRGRASIPRRFPRVSGDEPENGDIPSVGQLFSPRERG